MEYNPFNSIEDTYKIEDKTYEDELMSTIRYYSKLYKEGRLDLNSGKFNNLKKEILLCKDADVCECFLLCFGDKIKDSLPFRKIFCEKQHDPEVHTLLLEKIGGTKEEYAMHKESIDKFENQNDIWIKYFQDHLKEKGIKLTNNLNKNNNGK